MLPLSTACLAAAWTLLLLRDVIAAPWAVRIPPVAVAAILAVAAAASITARGRILSRLGLWVAIALAAISFGLFHLVPSNEEGARKTWRRGASHRIAATLRAVGNEVAHLEDVSTVLGTRVRDHVASRGEESIRSDPTEVFTLLDSLAQAASRGRSLTPGTAIGLQLFAADGARLAWAGWPQATLEVDRLFLKSGTEFFYTRTVSLYQILSHVVPCPARNGERGLTLLVDIPLEVDYRVNNRFLKSASLADNLPLVAAGRVSFEYFPPTGNLPERLERFRGQQTAYHERRERAIAAARARPRTLPPTDRKASHLRAGRMY